MNSALKAMPKTGDLEKGCKVSCLRGPGTAIPLALCVLDPLRQAFPEAIVAAVPPVSGSGVARIAVFAVFGADDAVLQFWESWIVSVAVAIVVSVAVAAVLRSFEFGAAFAAVASANHVIVADDAAHQASDDKALSFDSLVPACHDAVGVGSLGCPRSFAFPNNDSCASGSNSSEDFGRESAHSPTGARTSHGLGSIASNLGLNRNRSSGPTCNKPSPGHNTESDTNGLPKSATTNHSRKRDPHLCQAQRTHHLYPEALSPLEMP